MAFSGTALGEQLNFQGPATGGNFPFITFPNGVQMFTGFGSPNTVVTAIVGSLYLDNNGGLWVKATGVGNSGWYKVLLSNVAAGYALPTYANNAAALAGGLVTGDVYKDTAASPVVHVVA